MASGQGGSHANGRVKRQEMRVVPHRGGGLASLHQFPTVSLCTRRERTLKYEPANYLKLDKDFPTKSLQLKTLEKENCEGVHLFCQIQTARMVPPLGNWPRPNWPAHKGGGQLPPRVGTGPNITRMT